MNFKELRKGIDEAELIRLTQEMIRIETVNPPGNEEKLAQFLQEKLMGYGIQGTVMPFAEKRANLVARIPGSGEKPPLVFCGHLDTVPLGPKKWDYDPLSGAVAEGKIYGRGASDMKSGVAAMIMAAAALQSQAVSLQGDLVFAFTGGEEVDCSGANHLLKRGLLKDAAALLIAEPTGLEVAIAQKGALWLEIIMRGESAHGSSPQLGKNAILPTADLIRRIQQIDLGNFRHELLGPSTINVGTIVGGTNINIVPEECRLTADIRTVPGQMHEELREMISREALISAKKHEVDSEVRIVASRQSVATPSNHPFVKAFQENAAHVLGTEPVLAGVSYFTDGAVLVPALNIPLVICGPGEASCAHQTNEWVEIEKLKAAALLYASFAVRWLS